MNKYQKILFSSVIVILITLTAFLLNANGKKNVAEREYKKSKKELENSSIQLKYMTQKSKADELFILGEYDSAMFIYNEIALEYGEKDLVNKRNELIPIEESNSDSTIFIKVEDQEKIETLCNLHKHQLDSMDSIRVVQLDSFQLFHNNQISKLEKELNIEKNKEKAPKIGKLNFYSKNGTLIYYFGEVKNDKANGRGMGHYASGSLYIGEWKDNLKHDKKGYYKWTNNDWYEGEYNLDKRSGKGTYYWSNGEKYIGEWLNDKRSGKGTLFDKDNNVIFDGLWENDEFVK